MAQEQQTDLAVFTPASVQARRGKLESLYVAPAAYAGFVSRRHAWTRMEDGTKWNIFLPEVYEIRRAVKQLGIAAAIPRYPCPERIALLPKIKEALKERAEHLLVVAPPMPQRRIAMLFCAFCLRPFEYFEEQPLCADVFIEKETDQRLHVGRPGVESGDSTICCECKTVNLIDYVPYQDWEGELFSPEVRR